MDEVIFLNGELIPRSRARLSPFDHGFLYGYGLFETMRAYGGIIFGLDLHLTRLQSAAETLRLALPDLDDLTKACYDVLEANKLLEARLRLTISAGEGDITPNPASCSHITVFIVARELVPLPRQTYEKGFKTILSSWRRNSQSPLSRLKSTCYLENIQARQEAREQQADEALLLNERGLLAEGSASNIFLVDNGTLITPSVESGALPGITRGIVLEISKSLWLKFTERDVKLDELVSAREAFLTNSIIEIMPLTWLGDTPVGRGEPGPLTQKIMAAYKKLVETARNQAS